MKDFNLMENKKFLIRETFINKKTGQGMITIPKKEILGLFHLNKIPDKFILIPFNRKMKGGGR